MILRRIRALAGAGILSLAAPLAGAAQEGGLAAPCAQVPAGEARTVCLAVAQAAESAQPQLGILLGGGNPVLGSVGAGGGGFRLPGIPNIDLTGRASVVFIRLPDLLTDQIAGAAGQVSQRLGVPAPALALDGAVGVFSGFGVLPGLGGVGAVDVLVSGAWLPFRAFGTEGFDTRAPDIAWGVGARVGLLRESFIAPGVSVSVMRRGLGSVAFGEVCPGLELPPPGGVCAEPGDLGEFRFDLTSWSTRAIAGKRLLGLGLAAGVGHDRYASDVAYAFRYEEAPGTTRVVRPEAAELRSTRWSVFGNASYQLLVASLALEAGWQQGGSPIPGFQGGEFDPRGGSFFGSAAVRLAF